MEEFYEELYPDTSSAQFSAEGRRPPIALPQDPLFDCNVNALNGYGVHDVYLVDFDGDSLGDGGFGTVFRGQHLYEDDMPVAIKKISFGVIRRGYDDDDDATNVSANSSNNPLELKRLIANIESQISEIIVLKRFRNDYRMVHLHEYFVSTEAETRITSLYIVTEFLQGGELFECIKDQIKKYLEQDQQRQEASQPFCEGDARDIFRNLLEAIQYMHERHVIHRDIKPSNLLLQVRGRPTSMKVADFGQSKELPPGETTRTSCGTPGYRPPEMYQGKPYGECVDMFSAGCVLFFLLAGYQPFASYPKHKIRNKTVRCEYRTNVESWNRVSSGAKSLVKSLLASADRRISAHEAMNHPWMQEDEEAEILKTDLTENVKSIVASLENEHERNSGRELMQAKLGSSQMSRGASVNRSMPVHVVPEPLEEQNGSPIETPGAIEPSPTQTVPTSTTSAPADPANAGSNQQQDEGLATPVSPETPTPEAQNGICSCLFRSRSSQKPPSVVPSRPPLSITSVDAPRGPDENPDPTESEIDAPIALDELTPTPIISQDFQLAENEDLVNLIYMGTDVPEHATLLVDYITAHSSSSDYAESAARSYVRKLVEAIGKLHENNIVHRNITLSNLLARDNGDIILKDMQYATETILGEACLSGYCGTPYVTTAPEVYTDFSYSEKVDVWSLGIVTYLLLCGVYPFFGTGNEPEIRRLTTQLAFPFSDVAPSDKAREFVRLLLQPDPDNRPSCRELLRHEWMLEDDRTLTNVSLEFAYGGLSVPDGFD